MFELQLPAVTMRIGDDPQMPAAALHHPQEFLDTRDRRAAVTNLALQAGHVEAGLVAPVVVAIARQSVLHAAESRRKFGAPRPVAQAIVQGVALGSGFATG